MRREVGVTLRGTIQPFMPFEKTGSRRSRVLAIPEPSDDPAGFDHLLPAEVGGSPPGLPNVLDLIRELSFEFSDQPGARRSSRVDSFAVR
jgi:hypothetical protein